MMTHIERIQTVMSGGIPDRMMHTMGCCLTRRHPIVPSQRENPVLENPRLEKLD